MSKNSLADTILAEMLGTALFNKKEEPRTSKMDRVMAKIIEKHYLGDAKKEEKKEEKKGRLSVVELVILLTIGSYVLGPFIDLARNAAIHAASTLH